MVELIVALAALALVAGLLWAWGAREPVFANGAGEVAWFVALKDARAEPPLPGDAVPLWRSRADFAMIGASDAYWTHFYIFRAARTPEITGSEDAFVAKVKLMRPPPLAFGVLKLLIATGILSRPADSKTGDAQALGFRADVMPSPQAIAELRAQPASYAPAMVNFLGYRENGGAAAYARYGRVAMRTVHRTGGKLLFAGRILEIVRPATAGPCVGAWDDLAAMRYDRPEAILSMEHVPEYRAALVHRDAGLARTVVIATTPR
ncbi:MAG: DUF1330 domain-containing protein [Hyphomonadaceae bacterium]